MTHDRQNGAIMRVIADAALQSRIARLLTVPHGEALLGVAVDECDGATAVHWSRDEREIIARPCGVVAW